MTSVEMQETILELQGKLLEARMQLMERSSCNMIFMLKCDVCGRTSDDRQGWMQFATPNEAHNAFSITTSLTHFEKDDGGSQWQDACSRKCVLAAIEEYFNQPPEIL